MLACYASRTGTKRNLAALRAALWGLLVSRAAEWRREGFEDWCADSGAWADFMAGRPFNLEEFERFLVWIAGEAVPPRFIVLPDIVAGGLESLELSKRWLNRCLSICPLVLIAVQDGMEPADLAPLVGPSVGIFLGGSTEWKLARMVDWGRFCAHRDLYYHVARVNTAGRFQLAHDAGATSIDGSNASRFAKNVPKLVRAQMQSSLLDVRSEVA